MRPKSTLNLTVRRKLHIPNVLYLILLAIVIFFYFNSDSLVKNLSEEQKNSNKLSEKIRKTAYITKDYLNNEITFSDLEKKYSELKNTYLEAEFSSIWKQIERIHKITENNIRIGGILQN